MHILPPYSLFGGGQLPPLPPTSRIHALNCIVCVLLQLVKAFFNENITLKPPNSLAPGAEVQTGIDMLQSYIYTCL